MWKYRKNHLPFLGVDRFIDPGDQTFQIYSTPIGNIGLHICYDCNFPESARVMALLGADIPALPTNWPEGRDKVAKYVVNPRVYENKMHLMADAPGRQSFNEFYNAHTIEFIDTLRMLSQRKTFKGTCPVCKDWQ